MHGWVKYPFRVKSNGVYYAPGEIIETDNVAEAVEQGAEAVDKPQTGREKKKKQ